jgi:hypothetical protein
MVKNFSRQLTLTAERHYGLSNGANEHYFHMEIQMINEHDIKDMHEENKDKQPEAKPEPKRQPIQLSFEFEFTTEEDLEAILATIPFGR